MICVYVFWPVDVTLRCLFYIWLFWYLEANNEHFIHYSDIDYIKIKAMELFLRSVSIKQLTQKEGVYNSASFPV